MSAIHAVRSPALLVAVDHEGGRVQRFRSEFSVLPPLRRIGKEYDLEAKGDRRVYPKHADVAKVHVIGEPDHAPGARMAEERERKHEQVRRDQDDHHPLPAAEPSRTGHRDQDRPRERRSYAPFMPTP